MSTNYVKPSVISQKGESQNGCIEKTNMSNFPKDEHFTYVCVSAGKKCSFFGKFDVLCFLETPVLRSAFLPYYRRNILMKVLVKNSQQLLAFNYFYKKTHQRSVKGS